jgi:hypothetical protein
MNRGRVPLPQAGVSYCCNCAGTIQPATLTESPDRKRSLFRFVSNCGITLMNKFSFRLEVNTMKYLITCLMDKGKPIDGYIVVLEKPGEGSL